MARADRDQQSNRTADRAQSAMGGGGGRTSGGSAGRPGGVGNVGQTNRARIATSPSAGRPGGVGYVAGPQEQNRLRDYKSATDEYNNRGFLGRAADLLAGPLFNQNEPVYGQPQTYNAGQYHTSTDIPGTLGMLAGAAFPGGGLVGGTAGSLLGKAFGIGDTYHHQITPGQTAQYGGMGTPNVMSGGGIFGGLGGSGQPNQNMASNTDNAPNGADHLTMLAGLHQNVPGNPSAPTSVGPMPQPAGPDYSKIMAQIKSITPGYGVSLPGYQYKATV